MERSFPVVLCELRKERGISQKEAAEALGVSQALLSHYEKGIRECGQDFLLRAADFYKVTCDYLLGRASSKSAIGDYLNLGNLPPDNDEFSNYTLFRAALEICDKLAAGELAKDLDYSIYVSVELYRIIINAVAAGVLPKSWLVHDDDEYLSPLSRSVVNTVCSTIISSPRTPVPDENAPVPRCIKAVGNVAHDCLMKNLARAIPPFPDKYKK